MDHRVPQEGRVGIPIAPIAPIVPIVQIETLHVHHHVIQIQVQIEIQIQVQSQVQKEANALIARAQIDQHAMVNSNQDGRAKRVKNAHFHAQINVLASQAALIGMKEVQTLSREMKGVAIAL